MRSLKRVALTLAAALVLAAETEAAADPSTASPEIAITTEVEDGEKVLVATVTRGGAAVEGAKVAFFVRRTFGLLPLGAEETIEDGTAAVPFPKRLPGGRDGKLEVIAEITAPEEYRSVRTATAVDGGIVVRREADPFPRALWAPRAPLSLVLTISLLLGAVWCTYAYVFLQLRAIRKGGDA